MKRFLMTALIMGSTALAAAPQAQVMMQNVDVILPDGTMLTIAEMPNAPWWKDPRVLPYDRYVFDPGHNAYRVYDSANWKDYDGKWNGIGAGGNRRPGTDAPQPTKPDVMVPGHPMDGMGRH